MIRTFLLSAALAALATTVGAQTSGEINIPRDPEWEAVATACTAGVAATAVAAPPAAAFILFTCIVIGGQAWSNQQ